MDQMQSIENIRVGMGKKRFYLTTCSLYLLFFMGDAFLTSYYSHYFIANGMDPMQQSILLGIIPFSLFLGCVIMSPFAKNSRRALILFRACALLEASLSIGFAFCSSFWALLPMTFLIGFFNGAPFPFIEGYVAPRAQALGIPFSTVRMFGTLGYIVSLLLGYLVLANLPVRDCYYFAGSLFFVAYLISFLLKAKSQVIVEEEQIEKPSKKGRFICKPLIIFLISQLFLYGAFTAMSYLLPVRLKGLGLSDSDYSLIRGFGMVAELVTMLLIPLFGKKIRRYKIPILIASFVCLSASACGIFATSSYGLAYSALLLSGIGKAFLFAYQALFLQGIIGEERLAEALTINTAVTNLTAAGLNLASSSIYTAWTFQGYFGLIVGLEVVGVVLVFLIRPKRTETSASEG